MKHLIPLFAFTLCISFSAHSQYVSIPDSLFRDFLITNFPGCMNSEKKLDTTCTQILEARSIYLGSAVINDDYKIHDLTGLQYFKNLRYLNLYNNNINLGQTQLPASLDSLESPWAYGLSGIILNHSLRYWKADYSGNLGKPLPDSLRYFSCNGSSMDTLLPLPAFLEYLDVSTNYIRHLPGLPATLKYFNCNGNFIQALPALPAALTQLNCGNNNYIPVLPSLPPVLDTLIFGGTTSVGMISPITELPALPSTLTYLNFDGRIPQLPAFPASLKTLIMLDPDLTAIPELPSGMTTLKGYEIKAPSIPALPAGLDTLVIWNDSFLTALPALPPAVRYIEVPYNRLSSLPTLPPALTLLHCQGNRLTALPSIPAPVAVLNCAANNITALPPMPDGMVILYAARNQISTMPSLANTGITLLALNQNQLTTLGELPLVLNSLDCSSNHLTTLPPLPASIDTLVCNHNQLTSLPPFSHTTIQGLICSDNQLSELPDLPTNLEYLDCHNNSIYCLPRLPQPVCWLIIVTDTTKVKCVPNVQNNVYIQDGNMYHPWNYCGSNPPYDIALLPLCNPTNNQGSCHAYPIMSGNIFYDNNSNNTKDANEPYKTNCKVTLHNGEYTFTDNNGYFELAGTGLGFNTITVSPVRFFNCIPPAVNYNFTSFDTVVSRTYGLRANQVKDSMTISLVPVSWAARPGFVFTCQATWENVGTTTLDHTLTINYDDTKLVYDSSNRPLVANGNNLTLNTTGSVPGSRQDVVAYFTVRTTAELATTFVTRANLLANSVTYIDSMTRIIGGSYDPNDKQATPQLSPTQVANGANIDYTIRFQNTGTDTAFNVVLTDTLSSYLQTGTLQMMASSHNCKTTVKGNVVYFEFLNILLPDSNVNEPKSHGFVLFRIKPKTTVAVNTVIPNKAAIYFDYNAPVITNTATTLIKIPDPVPLKLISFSAVPQNDNAVSLYWNTANEINTKHFVVQRSDDGSYFNTVTNVPAKGRVNNNYHASVADASTTIVFYRLKMVDMDGTFAYSPIVKIDKRKTPAGISVLTNPVKDFLIINANDGRLHNTQAGIINMQGAVVKTFIVKEGSQAIKINDLPAGIYYIRTIAGNQKILLQ